MPTPLGDIFVRIGAQTKDFERGLDKVQKMSAKVFAGVSAAIAGVGVIGAGFEKEITKVGALTGATGEKFEQLGKVARSVAAETEFTAKQAAEGMSFFAMAGFMAEQSMAALRPATILATTGFMDLGTAADIVTNVMSGFGIGFDQLDKSIDVLVATATNANTTVEQLGEAMSYAAPVMKSFGISFEESAAAMGILSDAGIQASRAGTNLRMAITKLAKPTSDATAVLEKYGIEIFDNDGKMKSLTDIFGQFAGAGASATEMLKIFGPRAASAALILTESMKPGVDDTKKTLESFTQTLENSGGRANEIFEKMSQTVGFQFNVLKSNVEEAALVFYDELRPAIMGAIKVGQKVAKIIAQLDPDTKALITSVALLTAGISGLGVAMSSIGKIAMIAFAPANLTIMAMAAAIGVVAGAALILINHWDGIVKKVKEAARWIGIISDTDIEAKAQATAADSPASGEPGLGDRFGVALKSVMSDIKDSVGGGLSKVMDSLGFDLDGTGDDVKQFGKELGKVSKKADQAATNLGKLGGKGAGGFDFAKMSIAPVFGEGLEVWVSEADKAYQTRLDAWKASQDKYQKGLEAQQAKDLQTLDMLAEKRLAAVARTKAKDAAPGNFALQKAGELLPGEVHGVMQGFMAGGPIGAIIGFIFEILKKMEPIKTAMGQISEGFSMIAEAFSPIFDGLVEMGAMANESLGEMLKAIQPAINAIKRIFGVFFKVLGPIFKIINKIIEVIFTVLEPILSAIAGVLEMMKPIFEAIISVFGWIVNAIGDAVKWFVKAIKDILGFFGIKLGPSVETLNAQTNDLTKAHIEANTASTSATQAQNALTESTERANQEISNIPEGFKLVGHMLDSILDANAQAMPSINTPAAATPSPGVWSPGSAPMTPAEAEAARHTAANTTVINIDRLSADGATLDEIAVSVVEKLEEQSLMETGASYIAANSGGGQGRM